MNTPGGFYLTKTLQDAAEATGAGESLLILGDAFGGQEMVVIQLSGTFTATVTFQATANGVTWADVEFTPLAALDTPATTATTAGLYQANLKGCLRVRASVTAYTDGNVTAYAVAVA